MLVALAVPAVLFVRALPSRGISRLAVAGPEDQVLRVVGWSQRSGRLELQPPSFPAVPRPVLLLRVGTYLKRPTARVEIRVLDAAGRPLAACRFAPSDYRDNALLPCPLDRAPAARRIVIAATGAAGALAVYGRPQPSGPPVAGSLQETVTAYRGGLGARLRQEWQRLGVVRPGPFGPALLYTATALGLLATLLALWLAVGPRPRGTGDPANVNKT